MSQQQEGEAAVAAAHREAAQEGTAGAIRELAPGVTQPASGQAAGPAQPRR